MAIKSILFNTEMVRAILDGRKTCTRRIVKDGIPDDAMWGYTAFTHKGYISCRGVYADGYGEGFFKLPYQPGDLLYVRETWGHPISLNSDKQYVFRADKIAESGFKNDSHIWHPSIHMPKEAARIWLKVTNVRVERLQDITPKDAENEGVGNLFYEDIGYSEKKYGTEVDPEYGIAKEQFAWLWESTIKKSDLDRYGWDANPWVWVIEFERCESQEGQNV
nr:MAG TPA: ASCH domain protein [Caudoviricetes sp.]